MQQHYVEQIPNANSRALALAVRQAFTDKCACQPPGWVLMPRRVSRVLQYASGTWRKPIETMAVGDLVWAWDEHASRRVARRVVRLFAHRAGRLVAVRIRSDRGIAELVEATAEHPFRVIGKGWVAAACLAPGDELMAFDARSKLRVESASATGTAAEVFNVEVAQAHNYHIGLSGALVHNKSSLEGDEQGGTCDEVPAIRVAFELEQYDGFLQHIVHKLDIDHLQSTLPRDLRSYYVSDIRPDSYVLDFAASRGISMGTMSPAELVRASAFDQLPRITQAHLVIQATPKDPFKLQAGPIRLKPSASAEDIEAFSGMSGMKDGGALEVFNANDAPVYGTDGLLQSIDKYVRIYPRESGMSVEVLGHLMHAHFSDRLGKKMVWARCMNVLLPINILKTPGGHDILTQQLSGLSPIHEKGVTRVVDAYEGRATRVEVRTLAYYDNELSLRDNIAEIALSFSEEHRLYKHLRMTMGTSDAQVRKIFDSARKAVLMDDLHYLLRTKEMGLRIPHAMDAWPTSMGAIRQEIRRLAVPRLYGYSIPTVDDAVDPVRSRYDFMSDEVDPLRP